MINAIKHASNALEGSEAATDFRQRLKERFWRRELSLEAALIVVILGLGVLLQSMQSFRFVILNVYFLPIALAGFYLGRYRAGIMALLCVLSVAIVTALQLLDPTSTSAPLLIALSVTIWGAVLGLTALLIGTLTDERFHKLSELHDAYVGVVEVLTQYLQGAHPRLKTRSIRVAELSQRVATIMKLSTAEIDDIRVGSLLFDVGHIEITTRVIRRAMDTLDTSAIGTNSHTIQGTDLMLSLGSVLNGAVPLLLSQQEGRLSGTSTTAEDALLGSKIIRAVRAFDALVEDGVGQQAMDANEALMSLRTNNSQPYDARVLTALEQAVHSNLSNMSHRVSGHTAAMR